MGQVGVFVFPCGIIHRFKEKWKNINFVKAFKTIK